MPKNEPKTNLNEPKTNLRSLGHDKSKFFRISKSYLGYEEGEGNLRGDEVFPSGDVVVRDNRIESVGASGTVATPSGAKVIDVSGKFIVPGFIDTHAHWFNIRRGVLDLQDWDFLASLAYGITGGRDPQTSTNDAFAYQDLEESGEIIGPRGYSTGPGMFLCERPSVGNGSRSCTEEV